MDEKLNLCHSHANAVKRLFCNVGLLGPQVTTVARWKPGRMCTLPARAQTQKQFYEKDPTLRNHSLND